MADAPGTDRGEALTATWTTDSVLTLVRVVLGFIFVVASIDKIADPAAFAQSINNYRIVQPSVAVYIATILPWVEIVCGFTLIIGVTARGSALLTSILLAAFTAAVILALARGLDISCGCFTQDPEAGTIGWNKVVENLLMLSGSVSLVFSPTTRFSLEHYYDVPHA